MDSNDRPGPGPLLTLRDVRADRGGNLVLQDVRMELGRGESWAVLGASGSGKSTLAGVIAGDLRYRGCLSWSVPDGGRAPVALVGQDAASGDSPGARRYYQQRYNAADADEGLTLREALDPGGSFPPELARWAELLRLEPLLARPVIQLSTGERKRAQVAKALVGRPALLLLDEPFTGLDAAGREALGAALARLRAEGTQMIVFTSRAEPPGFVTHVAALEGGRLSAPVPRDRYRPPRAGLRPAPGPIPVPRPQAGPPFATAVRLVDAVVRYGDRVALDRVGWEVRRGERWCLTGPNGAGKSTLLSLVTADHPQAYANELYLFDRRRGSGETIWDIKRRVGFVSPELHAAFPRDVTCADAVASGLSDSVGRPAAIGADDAARVREWLAAVGEEGSGDRPLAALPLGRQRMVLLARALVKEPPLLILDEPCQGLDEGQVAAFLGLLDAVCAARGTTLIYVSHVEAELPRCATMSLRLEAGRVVHRGARNPASARGLPPPAPHPGV